MATGSRDKTGNVQLYLTGTAQPLPDAGALRRTASGGQVLAGEPALVQRTNCAGGEAPGSKRVVAA